MNLEKLMRRENLVSSFEKSYNLENFFFTWISYFGEQHKRNQILNKTEGYITKI